MTAHSARGIEWVMWVKNECRCASSSSSCMRRRNIHDCWTEWVPRVERRYYGLMDFDEGRFVFVRETIFETSSVYHFLLLLLLFLFSLFHLFGTFVSSIMLLIQWSTVRAHPLLWHAGQLYYHRFTITDLVVTSELAIRQLHYKALFRSNPWNAL